MRYKFIILILLGYSIPSLGQLHAGYGIGWFPTGMNTLKVSQRYFNESTSAETLHGKLEKEGNYLPVYHGITLQWNIKSKKRQSFQINWINLNNKGESSRINATDITYYHRTKSRINTYLFGLNSKPKSSFFNWANGFTFQAFMTTHTYLNSIGPHKEFAKGWDSKDRDFDFGLDLGVNIKTGRASHLFLHYSQGMFLFSSFNPSYFGAQFYIQLTNRKK